MRPHPDDTPATAGSDPLAPLDPARFDADAARHLLLRAGFGGTPSQASALAAMGLDRAVAALVDYGQFEYERVSAEDFDASIITPLTPEERAELQQARRDKNEEIVERYQKRENAAKAADREQLLDMKKWWLRRMIETPRPLEEKMTLFWHGHFATGFRTIENSWHLFQQNHLFRTHALGRFDRLVLEIIRDPAMLAYLDNDDSRKGRPNENLARELLELFVLGEGSGYTEQDIKEGARALTGYTFVDDEFVFQEGNHDQGPKTIFGQRGNWTGDEFAWLALNRRACSEFLCGKLYRFFVNDAVDAPARPEAAPVVRAMAALLRREQYELRPALRALLRSAHFYAPANRAAMIKSPVQLVVQTVRQFRCPPRRLSALAAACDLMGQDLFQPPNVKGWEGGRAWINTSTLFVRQNVAVYLLTGKRPEVYDWEIDDERFDALPLVEHLRRDGAAAPEALAQALLRTALAGPARPERVQEIARVLRADGPGDENARILAALALATALPEFQLC